MDCPECDAQMLSFAVPADLRDYLPGEQPGAAICPRCLELRPVADPPEELPDFRQIDDSFPAESEAAIPMALVVGLLSSLAIHRQEISALLEHVERAGADPLLVVDRLSIADGVETSVDLQGRRRQLEQLL
ncbi:Uncharacterized protein SVXHr_2612 [Halorhabdus sp. SVX81]|uniref:DUF6276 family protein n=1 Tax=Halorhabdus sp. SVX81 TaxID=2978283 RepID=UPI0023DC9181|nr:DUF6276 family protein [Halorhabdus sp. SVX81]WEL18756.1 Uncharacterized protein SVXHr_2612 [Halorhabdus sp. SVX81]